MNKAILIFILILGICSTPGFCGSQYDRILVVVNDRVITKNEVELNLGLRLQNNNIATEEQKKELRETVINGMIEETLLDIKADELAIKVTDEMLEEEIKRLMTLNKITRPQFEELLERQNMTLAEFQKVRKKQMRREIVLNREVRSGINIDEATLKQEFEKSDNKTVLVRARHIFVRLGRSSSASEAETALKKINAVRKKIMEGTRFEDAATQYSEDPSAKSNKGDLGFFKREDMALAEFADAAFALEPGQLSEPVRSSAGYHLIEVLERKEQPSRPYEEMKEELYKKEYQKVYRDKFTIYIAELKAKARIDIRKID